MNHKSKILACPARAAIIFFGLMAVTIWAEEIRFKHLTIDDGLSQNAVFAILQDRRGFMWFGTKDGLNRYDGYSFVIYQHNPFDSTSLSANHVTALFEDSRGDLWVGTLNAGLNRLRRETARFQRFVTAPDLNNQITAITEDSAGNIWVGTSGGGLLQLLRQGLDAPGNLRADFIRFIHQPGVAGSLSHNEVNALLVDAGGNLWVGTDKGLDELRELGGAVVFEHHPIFVKNPRAPVGARDSSITALSQDNNGALWLGTTSGIVRFDAGDGSFMAYPHHYEIYRYDWGTILAIVQDRRGRLWLATPAELMRFDPQRETYDYFRHDPFDPHSLSYNYVASIHRDRTDILWFGTLGYGVNVYDPKANRFPTLRRSKDAASRIAGFSVRSILEDASGKVWVSAEVLYCWDRQAGKLKSFETTSERLDDFGNTGAFSMLQASDGKVWFATTEGLFRYTLQTDAVRQYKHDPANPAGLPQKKVSAVFEDRAGDIWVATRNYLSQLVDEQSGRFRHVQYTDKTSEELARLQIYQDESGRFWLGTGDGLLRFDPGTQSFRAYRNDPKQPMSLSNNVIKSLCPDPDEADHVLWLGTAGGGLNRFDMATETFRHFTEAEGLPNSVVYGILPDEHGHLWLSTNKGLSRFNRKTGSFRNYNVSDGLQSNEFNTGAFYRSKSGEMFFGGINGLNYFHPSDIIDNPHPPPVVITGLKIFNRPVSPKDSNAVLQKSISEAEAITLSHRENILTFEFAALDFSAPEKNQYAYMMENFNDDWIHTGSTRSATFTNLSPGDYIFRVKASNNDGVWNEEGAALRITITPPWWRTWWAYLLYGLAVLAALYFTRRYELDRLDLRNRLRLEHVAAEKLREVDQMKSRFFANISHEFRTPLTLILGPMDSLLATLENQEARQNLQMMRRNAGRLLQLINQLLDLSKLESGKMQLQAACKDVIPVLRGIVMTFQAMAERMEITLLFHSEAETLELYFDHEKFEKIFFNLLSNAFKFTRAGAGGKVSVTVERPSAREAERESGEKGAAFFPFSPSPTQFVQITVKDTGIGIPQNKLPYIFDRFYQVETNSTREFEGTGIGLSLAKELVELHHGTIEINSQEGWGTEAIVRLPMGRAHLREEEIVEAGAQFAGGNWQEANEKVAPAPTMRKFTVPSISQQATGNEQPLILIVEDNNDMRRYLGEYLEKAYGVIEARNGKEGMEKAMAMIPDLIVSDVMMPEMDGYALCNALKTDEKTSHIPVILLTAKAAQEEKLAGLQTGADDYLVKPFDAKELLVRVKNLIQLRQQLREKFSSARLPEHMPGIENKLDQAFLQRVRKVVEENMEKEEFGVEELAQKLKLSRTQLHRKIGALTNQPASLFIRSVRLHHARKMLEQDGNLINEVAYRVGFSSHAYFTKCFHEEFGCTPKEFVKSRRDV
jgi:signal transduction histidine kinase/ligand-binding sensor domain-containing protein/DNA-binding response OmpR family regulator